MLQPTACCNRCATIVVFRDYTALQPMLVLVILMVFAVATAVLHPFYNRIITHLYVAGEVRCAALS